ncbi:MAG: ABC transporter permease [Bacteroidetes bacterium]|nr:MAG: ABC transporter permease [Bacteroidota bacterium]
MIPNKYLGIGYKVLAVLLLLYAVVYGMLAQLPELPTLGQSSRNIFYHVPLWFVTLTMAGISLAYSLKYLRLTDPDAPRSGNPLLADARAREAAQLSALFISLGLATGIIWQRVTWGADMHSGELTAWWAWDPVQVCALIALLIYLAYFLLRSSFAEPEQRARIAAVYNIFAFATLIPLFFIIPKMLPGLHPTAEKGSFIFNKSDISNEFRLILYPGMLGFVLLGIWIFELRSRLAIAALKVEELLADKLYQTTSNG